MKKIAILLLLFINFITFSQNETEPKASDKDPIKFNELTLNAYLLIPGGFNVSYERIIDEETGIGIDVMFAFREYVGSDIKYYISPHYRKYFGKESAKGIFIETFLAFNKIDRSAILSDRSFFDTDVAFGVASGQKWVSKNGFITSLYLGIGRNLFKDYDFNLFLKFGISLGYRF